jgi:aminopeptidase N
MIRNRSVLFLAAAVLLAAFSAYAQEARPNFNREQTYDVQHYTIRASFDRRAKKVFGDTTVSLKPLKAATTSVELDAVGLAFDSVKLDGTDTQLKYRTTIDKVIVTLDKPYGPSDTVSIRFKYSTKEPKKGVYFVDAEKENGTGHSDQIWSQGEAEEARYWFPSFDFPSDKATTEEYITAQKGETVIGNGVLLGKAENADSTVTWHYKMPVPHSTYLVSFIIGEYVRVDDMYGNIPLGFYVYPGRENTARKAFGNTKKMIAVYEELTGVKFPYNKYDQAIVAHFQFGGMENITATTMADTEIFFADMGIGEGVVTDLVSHELAHSWFGDMVTCKNWAELWLNEGFATYMEAAYLEKVSGRAAYMAKVRADAGDFIVNDVISKKRNGLFNRLAGNVDALFQSDAVTYHKGGAVIHQLREQVGTDNFWKGINAYLNAHKFGNVESTDLRKAMEDASGQDLGWFFDQWVYGVGAPRITVQPTYSPSTKTLKVTITQSQRADTHVPLAFRMPVSIRVKNAEGSTDTPVDITKRLEVVSIKSTSTPTEIIFDPTDKVVIKNLKVLPVKVLR